MRKIYIQRVWNLDAPRSRSPNKHLMIFLDRASYGCQSGVILAALDLEPRCDGPSRARRFPPAPTIRPPGRVQAPWNQESAADHQGLKRSDQRTRLRDHASARSLIHPAPVHPCGEPCIPHKLEMGSHVSKPSTEREEFGRVVTGSNPGGMDIQTGMDYTDTKHSVFPPLSTLNSGLTILRAPSRRCVRNVDWTDNFITKSLHAGVLDADSRRIPPAGSPRVSSEWQGVAASHQDASKRPRAWSQPKQAWRRFQNNSSQSTARVTGPTSRCWGRRLAVLPSGGARLDISSTLRLRSSHSRSVVAIPSSTTVRHRRRSRFSPHSRRFCCECRLRR